MIDAMEGFHAAGSRETRLIDHVFRAFGASVPAETCSRFTKFINDTGDPKLICKGVTRWNVLLNLARDPCFLDDR
jgi:hypothetical protein